MTDSSREPARGDQHPRLQGADGLVVVAHGSVERPADLVEVAVERAEPVVEVAAEPVDLAGLVGQRLVAPPVGDRAQQRDQRGRGGQHDLAGGGVLDQATPSVSSAAARNDSAGTNSTTNSGVSGQRAPVLLGGEPVDVLAELAGVAMEGQLRARRRRRWTWRRGRRRAAPWRRPPPGGRPTRWTTRSGRRAPSSSRTCSLKSQRSTSPASSTARRRWSSPQRPRTWGGAARSTVRGSRGAASDTCWWNSPCQDARCRSRSCTWSLSRSRPCITSAWSTMPDGVRRARARPEHAQHAAEAEPDREGEDERQRVHATSLNETTDSARGERHNRSLDDPEQPAPPPAAAPRAGRRVGRQRGAGLRLLRAGHPRPRRRVAAAPVSVLWAWWGFAGAALTFPLQHWITRTVTALTPGSGRCAALPAGWRSWLVAGGRCVAGVVAWLARDLLFGRTRRGVPAARGRGRPWAPALLGVVRGTLSARAPVRRGRRQPGRRERRCAASPRRSCTPPAWTARARTARCLVAGYLAVARLAVVAAVRPRAAGHRIRESPLALPVGGVGLGQLLAQATLTGGPVLLARSRAARRPRSPRCSPGWRCSGRRTRFAIGLVAAADRPAHPRWSVEGRRDVLRRIRVALVVGRAGRRGRGRRRSAGRGSARR